MNRLHLGILSFACLLAGACEAPFTLNPQGEDPGVSKTPGTPTSAAGEQANGSFDPNVTMPEPGIPANSDVASGSASEGMDAPNTAPSGAEPTGGNASNNDQSADNSPQDTVEDDNGSVTASEPDGTPEELADGGPPSRDMTDGGATSLDAGAPDPSASRADGGAP